MRLADCPSRDSGASAGGVEQRSRRPILTLVGLPSPPEDRPSRVASYWLRTLPPRPCPRGTEHRGLSRPGSPPEQSPEGTSRGVGPPFRVLPGCTARWLSPCFPRARAHGPGPPLLGFLAPTTLALRVPLLCHGRRSRPQETGAATPPSVPPSGFREPLGGFGRVARADPSCPEPARTALTPKLRGRLSDRERPWDSPYRAFPSRGAVPRLRGRLLPCEFRHDRFPARGPRGCHDRFPACARPLPRLDESPRRTRR